MEAFTDDVPERGILGNLAMDEGVVVLARLGVFGSANKFEVVLALRLEIDLRGIKDRLRSVCEGVPIAIDEGVAGAWAGLARWVAGSWVRKLKGAAG